MKTVSKTDLTNAIYTSERLEPVVVALAKIDPQTFRYNGEDMAEVGKALAFFGQKLDQAKIVIEQADSQYQNRDQGLIFAAHERYIEIDQDIELAKREQASLMTAYQDKTDELRKKGFTEAEIAQIVEHPGEKIAELDVVIAALKGEKPKIQKFLDDTPRYEKSFLSGTRVLEKHETRIALGLAKPVQEAA